MFWGLAVEPGKRYMQTVAKSFHLSMACLEINTTDNDTVPIMLDYDGQEYVLCNLHRHKVMQCQLDLNFKAGEKIAFYSAGKSRVHLSGYILEELEDLELSDEEEDDQEEEETTPPKKSPVKRKDQSLNQPGNKKQKLDMADDSEDEDNMDDGFGGLMEEEDDEGDEEEEEEDDAEESDEQPTPVKNNLNKFQQNKTPIDKQKKRESVGQTPRTPVREQNGQTQTPHNQSGKKTKNKQMDETPKTDGAKDGALQKKVLQGGVSVQDLQVGSGPLAKPGREVTVYYVGRLRQNNKQFDSTTSGPGFKFNLGRSEVIKGWDIGVVGMRVGGKRTIAIPAPMAYGKKGQPPVIPPNSALVFDVELKSVI